MAVGDMRRGDAREPLQRLDAALRLLGLGRLGAEAAHEVFQMRDLRLLRLERLILLGDLFGAGTLEVVVIAGIAVDHAVVHMGDAVDGGVEEFAVMRHQQDAAGIARQVLLEPQDRFEVEMVGRLVEQQQVGPVHQRARQVEAHAPAAGEAGHRAFQRVAGETQAVQQLRGARLGAVTVDGLEVLLGLEPRRVMLDDVIFGRQDFFQLAQPDIAVQHELQRGLVGAGDLLFDIGDGLAALQRDLAAVGLELAANQAEQRGFAAAVLANQPDALVGERLQIRLLEQRYAALKVGQILDIEHGAMIAEGCAHPGEYGQIELF